MPTATPSDLIERTTDLPVTARRRAEPLLRRLVGSILRERRTADGRTLRDVAAEARVSVAYLSEIERGRKEASSEVLGAVCGALGMRLVDLLASAHDELVSADQRVAGRGAVVIDLAARVHRDGPPSVVSTGLSVPGAGSGTAVLLAA